MKIEMKLSADEIGEMIAEACETSDLMPIKLAGEVRLGKIALSKRGATLTLSVGDDEDTPSDEEEWPQCEECTEIFQPDHGNQKYCARCR